MRGQKRRKVKGALFTDQALSLKIFRADCHSREKMRATDSASRAQCVGVALAK
jgi:hypothetical protein